MQRTVWLLFVLVLACSSPLWTQVSCTSWKSIVEFSSYFSIKGSLTEALFLHWKWMGITGSQLEKPEEKQDQCFAICNQWSSSPVPGHDSSQRLLGTRRARAFSGTQRDDHRDTQQKGKYSCRCHLVGWEQGAGGFPACPCWLLSRCFLPGRPTSCSLPISLLCSLFPSRRMSYVLGLLMERLPWLHWSQGELHLPSSGGKSCPDCGKNTRWKKKATSPWVSGFHLQLSSLQFLILI